MADLNAILKNKMGLSVEQAKKSKILASLSGSYRQNMKSIHYSQLVPSTNQFYTEKELEDLIEANDYDKIFSDYFNTFIVSQCNKVDDVVATDILLM